jgi:hypothetical protein
MDGLAFSTEALHRLPLADAVWRALHFALGDAFLDEVWSRYHGRSYERVLKFSTLAHLVVDALLQHSGSGRQSFERAEEDGTLPVAIGSVYEKLGNLPLAVSAALLLGGTQRLQELLPVKPVVDPLADCWAGHELFIADGKAIKHVKRLLKPLRGLQAGILGARASVALNLRTGMAVSMVGHLDGEAGEAALTEELLPQMAAAAGPDRPWLVLLDRLYCNLTFPPRVLKAGGHFLIRYCTNTSFVPDPDKPAQESHDAQGRRIVQEWGRLGKTGGDRALDVRRITLYRANGKELISLITDLLDQVKYPAEDLLATYRQRWGIERVFHQITDVFSLRHLISTTPKGVLFQLSLCLLLYNTLQVVRAHLASHQECEPEKISNEKLFYDVERQMVALSEVVEVDTLLDLLGEVPSATELREDLRESLGDVWSRRWWKAPSSGGGGHQKVKKRVLGNHTSTYRVLQQAKE